MSILIQAINRYAVLNTKVVYFQNTMNLLKTRYYSQKKKARSSVVNMKTCIGIDIVNEILEKLKEIKILYINIKLCYNVLVE
jgi:hypothetical protein